MQSHHIWFDAPYLPVNEKRFVTGEVVQVPSSTTSTFILWIVPGASSLLGGARGRVYSPVFKTRDEKGELCWRFMKETAQSPHVSLYNEGESTRQLSLRSGIVHPRWNPEALYENKSLQIYSKNSDTFLSRYEGDILKAVHEGDQLVWYFQIERYSLVIAPLPERILLPPKLGAGLKQQTEEVCQDLSRLLEEAQGSDVEVRVGEQSLKLHRLVLTTRSEYFAALFRSGTREAETGVIELKGLSFDTVRSIVSYIYSGRLDDSTELEELYVASEMFRLEQLGLRLRELLLSTIASENVVARLVLADLHGVSVLKAACLEFIALNYEDVVSSEEFEQLLDSNTSLVKEALKSKRRKLVH